MQMSRNKKTKNLKYDWYPVFWIRKTELVLRMAPSIMTDISRCLDAVAHSFNPSYSGCWGRRTKKGWGICARSRTVWSSHSISPHPHPTPAAWDDHREDRGSKAGGSVGLGLPPTGESCHNIIMESSSAPSPQCQSQNKQTHWGGVASSKAACLITRESLA